MSGIKPVWATKVSPQKIRNLYEQDAKGIHDDELADDVGIALYARCDSMLFVSSANLGYPLCIVCRTEMPYSKEKDFVLLCPKCGWSITVGEYRDSFRGKTLNGVSILPELNEFLTKYPSAKTYAEKMRLIDFLLHAFHGDLCAEPSRPVASNMIEGDVGEVAKLIFTLAYGEHSTVSADAMKEWVEKFNRSISRNVDLSTGKLREGKKYLYDGIGKKFNKK